MGRTSNCRMPIVGWTLGQPVIKMHSLTESCPLPWEVRLVSAPIRQMRKWRHRKVIRHGGQSWGKETHQGWGCPLLHEAAQAFALCSSPLTTSMECQLWRGLSCAPPCLGGRPLECVCCFFVIFFIFPLCLGFFFFECVIYTIYSLYITVSLSPF